ncbi:MAG TPA: flagellar hook-length control protein FliK [Candidatus Deferrimicrobiaceae bacterium]
MAEELLQFADLVKPAAGRSAQGKKTGRKATVISGGFADALDTLSASAATRRAKSGTKSALPSKTQPESGTAHRAKTAVRKTPNEVPVEKPKVAPALAFATAQTAPTVESAVRIATVPHPPVAPESGIVAEQKERTSKNWKTGELPVEPATQKAEGRTAHAKRKSARDERPEIKPEALSESGKTTVPAPATQSAQAGQVAAGIVAAAETIAASPVPASVPTAVPSDPTPTHRSAGKVDMKAATDTVRPGTRSVGDDSGDSAAATARGSRPTVGNRASEIGTTPVATRIPFHQAGKAPEAATDSASAPSPTPQRKAQSTDGKTPTTPVSAHAATFPRSAAIDTSPATSEAPLYPAASPADAPRTTRTAQDKPSPMADTFAAAPGTPSRIHADAGSTPGTEAPRVAAHAAQAPSVAPSAPAGSSHVEAAAVAAVGADPASATSKPAHRETSTRQAGAESLAGREAATGVTPLPNSSGSSSGERGEARPDTAPNPFFAQAAPATKAAETVSFGLVAETAAPPAPDPLPVHEQVSMRLSTLPDGLHEVTLRLSPEQLGDLRIDLKLNGGRMDAVVRAESQDAREALLRDVPALREALASNGITLSSFDVSLSSGGQTADQNAPRQMGGWETGQGHRPQRESEPDAGSGGFRPVRPSVGENLGGTPGHWIA